MCCSRLSAIGERTLLRPHANSTACGMRTRGGVSTWLSLFRLGHDLLEKPLRTFSGHALPFPVQHADQREQPARGLEIDPHLALQALLQRARAFVMDAAAAHVDGLDLVRRRGADRLIVAVADHEIVLHDSTERRQRQQMHHDGRAVLAADIEHQPVAGDADMQGERPLARAFRREQVLFDQVIDRDRALVLDVRPGTPDRFLIERHRDDAVLRILVWWRLGHVWFRRSPTERACASRPSALPSVIAAPPSARSWSGPHFRIEVRFMKSSTPSPEENRAERAVGSTWLEPPT